MKRLAALLVVLASCKGTTEPSGFGVNVRIELGQLSASDRSLIVQAAVTVSGDESFHGTVDIKQAVSSGEVRFRYIPHTRSGTIDLQIDALASDGTVVASGSSGPVAIVDGKASDATVTLGAPILGDGGVDAGLDGSSPDLSPDLMGAVPKKQGEACTVNGECASAGGCVDGRCCDTTCSTSCNACNLTGHEGTCLPIAAGGSPATGHPSCAAAAMSTCQHDGMCDGKGACRNWPLGTVCKAPSCDSGQNKVTAQSTCDGNGTCNTPSAITCAPFLCKDAQSCYGTCTQTPGQCSTGNTCVGGSCGLKSIGAGCGAGPECSSGFCVDGVCCNEACADTCRSCNLAIGPGPGTCQTVSAGQDPRHVCPAGSSTNAVCTPGGCSGTGFKCLTATAGTPCAGSCSGASPVSTTCDASGACSQPSTGAACPTCQSCTASATSASCIAVGNGTTCGSASCSSNPGYVIPAPVCSAGSCMTQSAVSCGGTLCTGSACLPSCTKDLDCLSTDYCNGSNACVPKKPDGQACTAADQCANGNCVAPVYGSTSVCCNSQCSGTGMSCDAPGSLGTCACQGMSCANGCEIFYIDSDNDGHGDETGTLANGRAAAGCVGNASINIGGKNYYPDDQANHGHLDCDDADPNVFYGQTTFFATASLHRGFDYNCDGVLTKGIPEYPNDCQSCTYWAAAPNCRPAANCSTDPAVAGPNSGFICGFTCPNGMGGFACCGAANNTGFPGTVACGAAGGNSTPYTVCGACPGGSAPSKTTDPNQKQTCR